MARAYNAKAQIDNAQKQMIYGTIGTIGGALLGGPIGAAAGGNVAGSVAPQSQYVPESQPVMTQPDYSYNTYLQNQAGYSFDPASRPAYSFNMRNR
jgi:hypothetical protein